MFRVNVSCTRFELGTLTNATRYINQFTEIFTEEGRKNVKITHKVPNQPPRVSFTPGMRASMNQQAAAATTNSAPSAILQKKPPVQVSQQSGLRSMLECHKVQLQLATGSDLEPVSGEAGERRD